VSGLGFRVSTFHHLLHSICNFLAFRTSHAYCYWSYKVRHLLLPLEFFLLFIVFFPETLNSMFVFFFTLNPSSSNIVYLPKIKITQLETTSVKAWTCESWNCMGFIFVMELQPLNPYPLIYTLNLSLLNV
jgi:hypothetical protein